MKYIGNQEYFV